MEILASFKEILAKLADHNLVTKHTTRGSRGTTYSLAVDNLEAIVEQERKRAEMDELRKEVQS